MLLRSVFLAVWILGMGTGRIQLSACAYGRPPGADLHTCEDARLLVLDLLPRILAELLEVGHGDLAVLLGCAGCAGCAGCLGCLGCLPGCLPGCPTGCLTAWDCIGCTKGVRTQPVI